MAATWDQAERLEQIPELLARTAEIDERTRNTVYRRTFFQRFGLVGLAAAAALVVGIAVWRFPATSESVPIRAVTFLAAEARALRLPDGSLVSVRGDSKVSHDFSAGRRRVVLDSGEAFFQVMKDPARPFIVEADGVAVRAVGTAFNVRRAGDMIDVIVTEGRIRVASPSAAEQDAPIVSAGYTLSVADGAGASALVAQPITAAAIEAALKWRSPQLEFSRAPLTRVVAAFGEHSSSRIELGDPILAERTISGTFRADNVEGFLRLAELNFGMKVERRADGRIVLHPAR